MLKHIPSAYIPYLLSVQGAITATNVYPQQQYGVMTSALTQQRTTQTVYYVESGPPLSQPTQKCYTINASHFLIVSGICLTVNMLWYVSALHIM